MAEPQPAGADYQEGRALDQQGQLNPSYIVSQLTSSHEAMKCLGEALSGPLISSLQAAGAIPSSSQPRGLGGYQSGTALFQPSAQAGPTQFFQHPGFGGYPPYPQPFPPGEIFPQHQARRSALLGECSDADTLSLPDNRRANSLESDDQVSLHPGWDEDLDPPQSGEVSDELASFLKDSVLKPATNTQKKQWIDKCPIPKVQELRPPRMDMPMRLLVSKEISSHDQWLKKMQTTAYEAAGPLIHLLSNLEEEEEEMDTDKVKETLKLSLSLLGNCFARFSQERRRKVLVGINSQLGHMAEEVFESPDVLFGDGAVDRIQKRAEAIKTLQKVKQPFRQGGVQGKGLPVHRGKQGQFRYSIGKNRPLPYHNKSGRGGRGAKRGQ